MFKRRFKAFMMLSFLLISLTFSSISKVQGLVFVDFDSQNDVFHIVGNITTQGDYHEEIDIVELNINAQNVNLTFTGNVEDWESGFRGESTFVDTSAAVYFFENFDSDLAGYGEPFYPDYYISYNNLTGSSDLDVFFIKFNWEYNATFPFMGFWTGINWSEDVEQAKTIGFTSNKIIIANIPPEAYIMPENVTFFAISMVWEQEMGSTFGYYVDVAPEEFASILVDLDNITAPKNDNIRIIILSSMLIGLISFIGLAPIIIHQRRKKFL